MVMEDFFMNGDANIQKRGKKMLGISFLPAPSFLPLGSFPLTGESVSCSVVSNSL